MPAKKPANVEYKNESYLKTEYCDKGRTSVEIAADFDVDKETILYWLRKFNIEVRSRGSRGGEHHYNWKGGPQEIECVVCEEPFKAPHYEAKQGLIKCCSKECRSKHLSQMYTGEGNPQYGIRGEDNATYGRTGEAHPMYGVTGKANPLWAGGSRWRDGYRWTKARTTAIERDDSTCQECGLTNTEHLSVFGCEVHVHHKNAVSDGGAKFDVDNLVTLCVDCHSEKHQHGFPHQRNND